MSRVRGDENGYTVKPLYDSAAAERAHHAVLVAAGQIPFTVTRFIVHASPKGLPYNLLLPAAK